MKKYIFLQNIVAPYRIAMFNELEEQQFNFELLYMRMSENDRSWSIDLSTIKYKYFIDRHGFYLMLGRFHLHFNPILIYKIIKAKECELILGGSWNDLNVIFLCFLKRLGVVKNKIHFWSEANYLTIGASNDNDFKCKLRKFVFNSSNDFLIVPGYISKLTFDKWGIINRRFIDLPNTIDDDSLNLQSEISNNDKEQRDFSNNLPVFLLPVRLVENIKGIINFFTAIGSANVKKGNFLIAGDGPDKSKIEQFINENKYEEHIFVLGFCDYKKMSELYLNSDVFVLPSFSDPSPLSLVESLYFSLPVLVSNRCGNQFETVVEGKNGFVFDPLNHLDIKQSFEKIILQKKNWKTMGVFSNYIYQEKFEKTKVIEKFITSINGL